MKHRSTFVVVALAAGWLAAGYGCSTEPIEPRPKRNAAISSGAGGDEAAGSDGTGGDTAGGLVSTGAGGSSNVTTGGDTNVGAGGDLAGAGGSAVAGNGGGAGTSLGGAGTTGGDGGNGGNGAGGSAGGSGAAGAGGTNVTGGQCNATCMQGSGCSARSCWVVSANVVKTSTTIQPANAIDGDEKTRYSTGTDALGSEWFQVDLCHPATISGLSVYTGSGGGDVAEKYTVQVSLDGTQWTEVVHSDVPQVARASITFTPVSARYVRYNQTAVMTHWWSIHELDVVCGSADGG